VAEATLVSGALLRVTDSLVRTVLPWHAVCCPRAVQNLRDLRLTIVLAKYDSFVSKMTAQLQAKVAAFLTCKEAELGAWVESEGAGWASTTADEEATLGTFFGSEKVRTQGRLKAQGEALGERERALAGQLDGRERDETREQLGVFRSVCRGGSGLGFGSGLGSGSVGVEARALHSTIEVAQQQAGLDRTLALRAAARRVEDAHGWLKCLGDNTLTARQSEEVLTGLFGGLDGERERSLSSLQVSGVRVCLFAVCCWCGVVCVGSGSGCWCVMSEEVLTGLFGGLDVERERSLRSLQVSGVRGCLFVCLLLVWSVLVVVVGVGVW
jgi:hypothetical protein